MCPNINNPQPKIADWQEAARIVQLWKNNGEEVVFTNGCFDIVHYGHIQLLRDAAAQGTRLVVALNSDASVARLKGAHRPLQNEATRTAVMAALEMVDLVVIFDQDTPLELIERLLPDVLVKGGDWRVDQIVGSEAVLAAGGRVLSLPFAEGYSTTAVEQKIKASK